MAYTPNSKYWDKRAIDRLTNSEKLTDKYVNRINSVYDKALRDVQRDIDDLYRKYGNNTGLDPQKLKELLSKKETDAFWKTLDGKGLKQYVKNNYKARITRLEQLQGQIYARAKDIAPIENTENAIAYTGVVNNSYNRVMYDTAVGTGYDFTFNTLDTKTLDKMLGTAWSGSNYSERIWKNTDILADKLAVALTSAVATGQSQAKTVREIQQAFGVGKYYAERLVRTEANHFHNEAEAEAYTELGVEKYVFVATLDSRTSHVCQDHDGKIYTLKEKKTGENYPPLHPNCRSTVRSYFGKDYEPVLRRQRNPKTGKNEVVENMDYTEYLQRHDIAPTIPKNIPQTVPDQPKVVKTAPKPKTFDQIYQETYKTMPIVDHKQEYVSKFNSLMGSNKDTLEDMLASKSRLNNRNDIILDRIAKEKGFDGKPVVLDPTTFDQLPDDKYITMYRGVMDNENVTPKQIMDQFTDGDYHVGKGLYGNGYYTAGNVEVASHYAGDNMDNVMTMKLPKDAKICKLADTLDIDDIINYKGLDIDFADQMSRQKSYLLEKILHDPSMDAILRNYDVLEIPSKAYLHNLRASNGGKTPIEGFTDEDYKSWYVILNRTAVIVKGVK